VSAAHLCLLELLNRYDFWGLLADGAAPDAYLSESSLLERPIRHCKTEAALVPLLNDTFKSEKYSAVGQSEYQAAAKGIWLFLHT
jgi:hypothetical protein